jgi:hypothetical protein
MSCSICYSNVQPVAGAVKRNSRRQASKKAGACHAPQQALNMLSAADHWRACVLQVEHPVTEGITETNIPSIQLMVGMGIPLWRIPCLRATFNKDPYVSGWGRLRDFVHVC